MLQVLAWIVVPYFLFVYPVRKFMKRSRMDKEIDERSKATNEWADDFYKVYSSIKSEDLSRSFVKEHDDFVREIEDDLRFVFKTDDPVSLLNEQPYSRLSTQRTGDQTFRSLWHIVYHLYCAKHGVIAARSYSLWDKGDRINGEHKIVVTKLQGLRACAMIEKYLGEIYGPGKYLLFYDTTIPDGHTLTWKYKDGFGVGGRPW